MSDFDPKNEGIVYVVAVMIVLTLMAACLLSLVYK